MVAISIAMQNTGALDYMVGGIMLVIQNMHPIVVLSAIYLFTSICTEFFSNSAAALIDQAAGPLADAVADRLDSPVKHVRSVLTQIASRFDDVAMVAARESDRRSELATMAPTMVSVPWLEGDIHDLAGLGRLAGYLRNP
jgi:hypothetical protein